jgi:hypothetical protein
VTAFRLFAERFPFSFFSKQNGKRNDVSHCLEIISRASLSEGKGKRGKCKEATTHSVLQPPPMSWTKGGTRLWIAPPSAQASGLKPHASLLPIAKRTRKRAINPAGLARIRELVSRRAAAAADWAAAAKWEIKGRGASGQCLPTQRVGEKSLSGADNSGGAF